MTTRNTLSNRRELFAKLVASGNLSNTEAARRAGYRHPDRLGHRLRKVAAVQEMIAEIRSNTRVPAEALEEHLQTLEKIRDEAMATKRYAAALKAQLALGRALGLNDGLEAAPMPEAPAPSSAELVQRIVARLAKVEGLAAASYDD